MLCAIQTLHVHAHAAIKKAKKGKSTQKAIKASSKKGSLKRANNDSKQKSTSNSALSAIKRDIEKAKKKVGELELQEKNAMKGLATAKKKQLMVKEHVGKLMGEVRELQDTLETIRKTEATIQQKLNISRMTYARIAKKYQALMQKHAPDIAISPDILSGSMQFLGQSSMNRLPSYLRQMHTKLTLQMKEMQSLQGALSNQQEQISINSSRQERLLRESEYEQQNIRNILVEQKKKLESVRLSKEEVQKLIVKKEQSARQLSGLISSMVRNDIVKKEEKTSAEKPTHLQEKKRLGETPKKTSDIVSKKETQSEEPQRITQSTVQTRNDNTRVESLSGSFSGGFRWPSSAKRILRGFGQYKNSVTNTVMDNPGLDIACQAGSSAMCAATGIVSLVHWLPGYNSMVIVDHGNSYRTVYANLASISVKKGQKIEAGGLIGRTTQSVDGEFLHFEIWKGKQRMNPMAFLR
ncbi:hypothetical protein LBMAG35_03280 [Chlorobiota bacterium]|nr:hypothetical protein LBMAG35_03280 [Chlorobiota bacterium]